jgi:hypothetical protein
VPFLRFSRDKRGYEHFYLVQASPARRGKPVQRILYWFRTPPNVKVGREPFAEPVRRALEAQYPDLTFDWDAFAAMPIPAPETDHWRERRRAERAAKRAVEAVRTVDSPAVEEVEVEVDISADAEAEEPAASEERAVAAVAIEASVPGGPPAAEAASSTDPTRRRSRRRRGRRSRRPGNEAAPAFSGDRLQPDPEGPPEGGRHGDSLAGPEAKPQSD